MYSKENTRIENQVGQTLSFSDNVSKHNTQKN
jgi:hypothetical protein